MFTNDLTVILHQPINFQHLKRDDQTIYVKIKFNFFDNITIISLT